MLSSNLGEIIHAKQVVIIQKKKQAEAEVVPRSSLVEVQVEAQVGVEPEVGIEVGWGWGGQGWVADVFHNVDVLQI